MDAFPGFNHFFNLNASQISKGSIENFVMYSDNVEFQTCSCYSFKTSTIVGGDNSDIDDADRQHMNAAAIMSLVYRCWISLVKNQ